MGATAVVLGERVRVTKTNACGRPIAGAANRAVFDTLIRANLDPEMKARNDLEQNNAAGRVIVSHSTPAERKWWNTELQLGKLDPDLISLLASWARILDPDGNPIGVRDRAKVDPNTGVMVELWTLGEGDDDCPIPTDDSIFSTPASGINYGYFVFGLKELVSGAWTIEEAVTTWTWTGRTFEPKQWGRGPYNVANTALSGSAVVAGRLLTPLYDEDDENHFAFFRTPVEPPPVTDGAVGLAIESVFTSPNTYFGTGSEADVAPAQPDDNAGYTFTITGTPDGGTTSILVHYPDGSDDETGTIQFNATAANVKTALVALDDGYTTADWTTSGTTLPGGTVTIIPPFGVTLAEGDNNLTGGTTPAPHINPA